MAVIELGDVQMQFAQIVWANAPIPSGELVKLCEQELHWKKPTTYTVLRKLCEKGLFENRDGIVRVKMTREQFDAESSEQFISERFQGSLPAFLAAFTAKRPLSDADAQELMEMIEAFRARSRT